MVAALGLPHEYLRSWVVSLRVLFRVIARTAVDQHRNRDPQTLQQILILFGTEDFKSRNYLAEEDFLTTETLGTSCTGSWTFCFTPVAVNLLFWRHRFGWFAPLRHGIYIYTSVPRKWYRLRGSGG